MRRQSRYNKNHKSDAKKERIAMIASSVFVLAALTMTGIYVKGNSQKNANDGYRIDFSTLEKEPGKLNAGQQEKDKNIDISREEVLVNEDDLDYMPLEPVGSGTVEIPGITDKDMLLEQDADALMEKESLLEEAMPDEKTEKVTAEPEFQAGERLVWPVNGTVLIPYSMDKTVYFATLQQYKYHPAMVVSTAEGTPVSTVMSGTVTEVFEDEEIGNGIKVDIGKGYEVTYGQLADISVKKGDYVKKGEVIGSIAAPTKYYSVEGANAYFALTLNGEAVDPMGVMQ